MAVRKKIALCLEYPLALRGGVSVLVETLLQGLAPHYDLVLVSPDSVQDLITLPVAPLINQHFTWNPALVSASTSSKLAEQLAEAKVDLAHFHLGGNFGFGNRFVGQSPFLHLHNLGVPSCSTVHLVLKPLDGYCGPQKPLWFKLALFPLTYLGKLQVVSKVRREIAVSQQDCRKLKRWYWPVRRKFGHIYHSRLRKNALGDQPSSRESVILNVGHIAFRKGQHILVNAFAKIAAKHPEWKLLLLGDTVEPECFEQIEQVIKQYHLEQQVLLLGPRTDALNFMQKSAIFVQPSFFEGLPLALQEAMFSGCACIGSRISGNDEIISHQENGLLVRAGDAEALSAGLDQLISDQQLRQKFSQNGPASIIQKGMTSEQMLKKHLELYEAILSSR